MTNESEDTGLITRREAILRVSAMLGGMALVGQAAMLAGASRSEAQSRDSLFTAEDIALLEEIADTILPETGTPGAKAAGVGVFMALSVTDVYYAEDQAIFRDGLSVIDGRSRSMHGRAFVELSPDERLGLLEAFDVEQFEYMNDKEDDAPAHFFRMMKELSLLGYFTSEIGYTQAMRYTETPGRFDPCAPYEPGEKAWAEHA